MLGANNVAVWAVGSTVTVASLVVVGTSVLGIGSEEGPYVSPSTVLGSRVAGGTTVVAGPWI